MSNAPEYGQGQGTLTRAAGLVSDARADFTSLSAKLSDQIAAVQGKWGGQGATAFFTLHQTWSEKQRRHRQRARRLRELAHHDRARQRQHRRGAELELRPAHQPPQLIPLPPSRLSDTPQTTKENDMNLDGIRVNHAALDQAASEMVPRCGDIDRRMDQLEAELAPLKSDWIGSQQESYRVAKQKWDTAIEEMRHLLEDTHKSVTLSNQSYRDADTRGAAQFQF